MCDICLRRSARSIAMTIRTGIRYGLRTPGIEWLFAEVEACGECAKWARQAGLERTGIMGTKEEKQNFENFGQALANAIAAGDTEAIQEGIGIASAFVAVVQAATRKPFKLLVDLVRDGDIDALEPIEAQADAFTAKWNPQEQGSGD